MDAVAPQPTGADASGDAIAVAAKEPSLSPRGIPDRLWDELFDAMTCHRDRALLALLVSSAARASELLGLTLDRVDWAGQRIWVVSKGTNVLEPIPASPQAFTFLALYLEEAGLPGRGDGRHAGLGLRRAGKRAPLVALSQ